MWCVTFSQSGNGTFQSTIPLKASLATSVYFAGIVGRTVGARSSIENSLPPDDTMPDVPNSVECPLLHSGKFAHCIPLGGPTTVSLATALLSASCR